MRPYLARFAAVTLLLAGTSAQAEIYKYYDADGNLVLSDTVPKDRPEKAEKLQPRPIMTVPAVVPKGARAPAGAKSRAAAGDYVIVILSPAQGQTFEHGGEAVPVAVSVSPGLAAGLRLDTRLDGQPAGDPGAIVPGQLAPGSHTLSVQVVDAAGKVLKAAEVGFSVK